MAYVMTNLKKPAMTQTTIHIEKRSLKWWSEQSDISERTLAKWAELYGASAPYDDKKMVDILSFGIGRAELAVGCTRNLAIANAEKARRTIEWLP
jgi:hypothetical protein